MSTLKFPVVSWRDGQGFLTVSTVSGLVASAHGTELRKCLEQLKRFVIWKYDQAISPDPEFSSGSLEFFDVPVRGGYRSDDEFFPDDRPVSLKIPVVKGRRFDGLLVCILPTLNESFYCRDEKQLPDLVADQVRSVLNGQPAQTLSKFVCPEEVELQTMSVRIQSKARHETDASYPMLESVAIPFGKRSHKSTFPAAHERTTEVERLAQKLSSGRGNVLMVGSSGVGKSTLIVNAIRLLDRQLRSTDVAEMKQKIQFGERVWFTSADRIISGMQYLGEWEERVEGVISELSSIQGILCFENLEQLIRMGGCDPSESVGAFLIPFMENNELRLVVEATPHELDACRKRLPGFESLFDVFETEEFSEAQSRNVLLTLANQFKSNRKIDFDLPAADLCRRLHRRYLPYSTFPGNCVRFWNQCFLDGEPKRVDSDLVINRFVQQTGLPEVLIRDDFTITSAEIRQYFAERIIGQPQACSVVTHVITRLKAGLNDPDRPLGVQLFCGPTGVGKTEMAKTLTRYMFGSGEKQDDATSAQRLIRLDMSEYSAPGSAERLVMQSSGQPSQFIQRVRDQPMSVVLLDEIEKATPEVFDLLMGVFDEGRLTDRWGRTTDFRCSVIVMTSNLGVRQSQPIGFSADETSFFEKEVRRFFRPEFFNRFDGLVPFQPLSRKSIAKIIDLEMEKIERRVGLANRNLKIAVAEDVLEFLIDSGYDKRLGARPLQRSLETHVVSPLARLLAESPELKAQTLKLELIDGKVLVTQ